MLAGSGDALTCPVTESEQTHPLYATDRDLVDSLLGHQGEPGPEQLTAAGRLFSRYDGFPGALDIQGDLVKTLALWKLTRDELNTKTREIWASGWRPGRTLPDEVGSGADVEERDS